MNPDTGNPYALTKRTFCKSCDPSITLAIAIRKEREEHAKARDELSAANRQIMSMQAEIERLRRTRILVGAA